jgi:TRAP-type C4-dicarboxylate transport system substrate-binding protein
MTDKRSFLKAAAATAIAGPAIVTSKTARAQAVTLRVGSWLPAHHLIVAGIVRPWMQAVEADSEGTVKFDLMSASIGRPPEYYDFCANGAIDVGFGVLGHNPNRFLMTEVMGMPFMSIDPWAGSAASWLAFTKYGARYNEHKGVQLVGTWVHSEPYLHMRGEGLRTIDDLKGKKIRVGSAITGRIIQALGGTPVQLPPTEAQQAMMSGVADGITFPMESIEFFKITPAIKATTKIPGGLLYTDTFWLGVNEKKWASLNPKAQAAMQKHGGMAMALNAAWAWTSGDNLGRAALEKAGVKFNSLPDSDTAKIKAALKPLNDEWLAEAKKRGLPGEEIIKYALDMADRYKAAKRVNVV